MRHHLRFNVKPETLCAAGMQDTQRSLNSVETEALACLGFCYDEVPNLAD